MDRGAWWAMTNKRVRHNWSNLACMHTGAHSTLHFGNLLSTNWYLTVLFVSLITSQGIYHFIFGVDWISSSVAYLFISFICVFVGGICLFQIYTDSLYSPDSDFVYSQYLFKNFLLESIVDLQCCVSFRGIAN